METFRSCLCCASTLSQGVHKIFLVQLVLDLFWKYWLIRRIQFLYSDIEWNKKKSDEFSFSQKSCNVLDEEGCMFLHIYWKWHFHISPHVCLLVGAPVFCTLHKFFLLSVCTCVWMLSALKILAIDLIGIDSSTKGKPFENRSICA